MNGIQFNCIIIITLLSAHGFAVGVLFTIDENGGYYQEPLSSFFNWKTAMIDGSFGSRAFPDLQKSSYKSVNKK